jgi:endonuclease/exonuclease/phosphatase family metal-dependent hydrolase
MFASASIGFACPRNAAGTAPMGGLFRMSKQSLVWRRVARGVVFVFACGCLLMATAQAATGPSELRVMSFNVRFARAGHSEMATENNWNDPKYPRRERAVRVIQENGPDLLGVQEAREEQIADLKQALPEYEFYGLGRDDGKTAGEFSGIFFRKNRFAQEAAGSFWLSATPDKPGTTFSFNKLPRIASWVRLKDRELNREFVLLNMHWDHQDEKAREKTAELVRERLDKIGGDLPLVVTGDLNSFEDTLAYKTLVGKVDSSGRKLADSYRELHPERSPNEASFDDWRGKTKGSRIDFILHTSEFTPMAAEIVRTSYDGHWPSDHYPVTATLKLDRKSD